MARFPNTPKFTYGDDQALVLTLPTTPYLKAVTAVGGDIEADSGVRTAFIVRRDEELTMTLRIREEEWPAVQTFLDDAIAGNVFTWFPNADDEEESYEVTLITPTVNTSYQPTPDESYPRVLNLPITFMAASFDGSPASIREFQDEFETNRFGTDGASTERRPDAVSLDYLTAATLGPVATGDPSEGITYKWRVREEDGDVFICRENATGDAWGVEALLFSYANFVADPILELDFAFTQNGRAVVVAERAAGIWIYWFDPLVLGFVFVFLDVGRTPRCLLDDLDPLSESSDVLVFYVNDTASGGNGAIAYRQQRDRYEIEYLTPIIGGAVVDLGTGSGAGIPFHGKGFNGGITATIVGPNDMDVFQPPLHHGATFPPPGDPQFGDWQPIADSQFRPYQVIFEFDQPITQIDLEGHYLNYPSTNGQLRLVALSAWPPPATELASTAFPFVGVGDSTHNIVSLVYAPGFRFLSVGTAALDVRNAAAAPTFGPGTIYPLTPILTFTVPPIERIFLEDAVKTTDGRVSVLYALHDPGQGTYSLQRLVSSLYPVNGDPEAMTLSQHVMQSGELRVVIIIVAPEGTEENQVDYAFTAIEDALDTANFSLEAGALTINLIVALVPGESPPVGVSPDKIFFTTVEDAMTTGNHSLMSGTLLSILIVVILPGTSPPAGVDPAKVFFNVLEDFIDTANLSLQSGVIEIIVITYTGEDEAIDTDNMTLQSGTLVVP